MQQCFCIKAFSVYNKHHTPYSCASIMECHNLQSQTLNSMSVMLFNMAVPLSFFTRSLKER